MIGEILGDRYQIIELLAKKAGRRTLLAKDIQTENLVVVKLLTFDREFEWEDLKLFEREVQTLKFISHPAIPDYLDYFDWDSDRGKYLALVQSYVEGESLETQLNNGRHFTETEIKDIARQILEILTYLHDLNPPVIHRDIKPSNIILSNRSGNSIGQIHLVDFGSVQTVAAKGNGTITVVGTYGYMPPEQFGGRVVAASDLYSLAATLIFLATGIHPADLPQIDGRINFQKLTSFSPRFSNWLARAIDFSLERRFPSTNVALQALEELPLTDLTSAQIIKPNNRRIIWKKTSDRCQLIIPARKSKKWMLPVIILLTPYIFFATISLITRLFLGHLFFYLSPIFMIPTIISLAGILFIWIHLLFSRFGKVYLNIDPQKISLHSGVWGMKFARNKPSPRFKIDRIGHVKSIDKLVIYGEGEVYEIIPDRKLTPLSKTEVDWIAQELSDWLGLPISEY
jgi:serine/threonine protein kinase